MAKHSTQPWIPLHTNKWLNGSTREELQHDERAIFADFLCLASQNGGYIGANVEDGFPYSNKRLSDILAAPLELIERTLQRCLDTNKIERLENGILKIIKWEEYQLSDRWIRKLNSAKTEHTSENQEDYSEKADSRGEKRREEKNRKENIMDSNESEKQVVSKGFNNRNPLFLVAKGIAKVFWDEHKRTLGVAPKQPFMYKEGSKNLDKCLVHGAFLALGEWDGDEFIERYKSKELFAWIPVFFADNSPDTVNRCRRIGGRTWAAFMDWVSIEANGGVKK